MSTTETEAVNATSEVAMKPAVIEEHQIDAHHEEPRDNIDVKPTTNGEDNGGREVEGEEKASSGLEIAEEDEKLADEPKERSPLAHEEAVTETIMLSHEEDEVKGEGREKEEAPEKPQDDRKDHIAKDSEWEMIDETEVTETLGEGKAEEKGKESSAAPEAKQKPETEETPAEKELAEPSPTPMETEREVMEIDEREEERSEVVVEKKNEEEKKEDQPVKEKSPVVEDKIEQPKEDEDKVGEAPPAKTEESGGKRVLPKWMVQDADSPPSPKPEEASGGKAAEGGLTETAAPTPGRGRGRGRGRGGRGSARNTPAKPASVPESGDQPESLSSGRPRRSTRSTVDYAHPDVATVVAEQDDLENELQQKVTRGRGRGRGRGGRGRGAAKKAVAGGSEEDEEGDDSGSEYGRSKKKRAKTSTPARGRGRGRGRGKSSTRIARSAKRSKKMKDDKESDEEEEEMDLGEDEVPSTGSGEEEAYKPTPSKRRSEASQQWKQPPKKRGRSSAKAEHDD